MAEETTQNSEAPVRVEEVVVLEVSSRKPVAKDEKAVPEADKSAEVVIEVPVKEEEVEEEKKIFQQPSFKEETSVVSERPESQRKALEDSKKLILEALEKHKFSPLASASPKEEEKKVEEENKREEEQLPAAILEAEKPAEETAPSASIERSPQKQRRRLLKQRKRLLKQRSPKKMRPRRRKRWRRRGLSRPSRRPSWRWQQQHHHPRQKPWRRRRPHRQRNPPLLLPRRRCLFGKLPF